MPSIVDHFEILGMERQLDFSSETLRMHYDERCQEAHRAQGWIRTGVC